MNELSTQKQPALAEPVANRLFMALHGYFGNQFLDKFRTGQMQDGEDKGIKNARNVWATQLAEFDQNTLYRALRALRNSGASFAPSLPEFIQYCLAARKIEATKTQLMPTDSNYSEAARSHIAKIKAKHLMIKGNSLGALGTLCCQAVAAAGGDEIPVLRRFNEIVAGAK